MAVDPRNAHEWHAYQKLLRPRIYETEEGIRSMEEYRCKLSRNRQQAELESKLLRRQPSEQSEVEDNDQEHGERKTKTDTPPENFVTGTKQQLSKQLGVSRSTLDRWIAEKKLLVKKFSRQRWQIRKSDIDRLTGI